MMRPNISLFCLRPEALGPMRQWLALGAGVTAVHAGLVLAAAFWATKETWALVSGPGFYVAFAPLLPIGVEHRHDIFLELFARLLAGEPAAHGPAGIGPVADDQLEQVRPYVVAASRIAVRNSAIPLPVSLEVVKMDGCAAGCFAASTIVVS